MPEEAKSGTGPESQSSSDASAPSVSTSPAPSEVANGSSPPANEAPKPANGSTNSPTDDSKPADAKPAEAATAAVANVQTEPLADGTKPTVLTPGQSHHSVPKGKVSLNTVYRRADILTTLLTFVGALVAAVIIFAVYTYLTKSKAKTPTNPTKVTTLDKAQLDKLNAFFNGNSAGTSAEILTVSSSTLFKSRVALGSDLKVVGGVQVDGTTALGDLTVDKTSTLGVTNIRGQLTVAGPLNLQSPAQLGAGATVKGNLATSGNGSFGGSLSAGTINTTDLSVTGTLNLAGHLSIAGQNASATPVAGVSTSASIEGNDSSGVVTVNVAPTGNHLDTGAQLVTVNFHAVYPRAPHVVITPIGRGAALFEPYITVTASNFTIGAAVMPANSNATSYSFSYWVVQ